MTPHDDGARADQIAALQLEWLTAEECAQIARVSAATVRRALVREQLKGHRIGSRQWRVRVENLRAWLDGWEVKERA